MTDQHTPPWLPPSGGPGIPPITPPPESQWSELPGSWNVALSALQAIPVTSTPRAPRDLPAPGPAGQSEGSSSPEVPPLQIVARPPARKAPWVIVLIVLAVVAGVLWYGTRPTEEGPPSSSPSTQRSLPTPQTPGSFQSTIPFDQGGITGQFTINSYEWESGHLKANVTIEVTGGSLNYTFVFLDSASGDIFELASSTDPDRLTPGRLTSGDRVTGTIRCDKNRGNTLVVLRNESDRSNLAVLIVEG